jgi:hypothetical protein
METFLKHLKSIQINRNYEAGLKNKRINAVSDGIGRKQIINKMKASELRIGILVKDVILGSIFIVNEIHDDCIVFTDFNTKDVGIAGLNTIEGIEITEEWLLKFGFKHYVNKDSGCGHSILGDFNLWIDNGSIIYWKVRGSIGIKYVQQLQNLHFALTGEELTISNN